MERPAKPEEVARVEAFLAADDASCVTGDAVTVDGNCTARWQARSSVDGSHHPTPIIWSRGLEQSCSSSGSSPEGRKSEPCPATRKRFYRVKGERRAIDS